MKRGIPKIVLPLFMIRSGEILEWAKKIIHNQVGMLGID